MNLPLENVGKILWDISVDNQKGYFHLYCGLLLLTQNFVSSTTSRCLLSRVGEFG